MNTQSNTELIVEDFKILSRDAEELAIAAAGDVSERVQDARARLAKAISAARRSCQKWEEKALKEAKAADRFVQRHPYRAAGVALGLGALCCLLMARK